MTKLLLVRPPLPYLVQPNSYGPLGLGYLCAYVRKHLPDLKVEICDMAAGDKLGMAEIYGWTSTSLDYDRVCHHVANIKDDYPMSRHLLGGAHATAFGGKVHNLFDAVFVGEAERSLVDYLEKDRKRVWGEERVRPAMPLEDLDELPFPVRTRPEDKQLVAGDSHSITVMASRGCPFTCSFCASDVMWGRKVRWRSPENVVAEILDAKERWGVTDVAMIDDSLTVNKKWLLEFCRKVKAAKVHWRALSRVDVADAHIFESMRHAGCTEVCFGVESFDPAVLKMLNKHATPVQASESIELAHSLGLKTRVFMMISTPGETQSTVPLNISHIEDLKDAIDLMSLSTFMPLPGTPIWNKPAAYGVRIVEKDLSRFNRYQAKAGGETPIWSPIEIIGLPRKAQLANIQLMRDYWKSLKAANTGRPV